MTDPYLIISSDCHAGLPTEEYRPYLDSRFHRDFDEFLAGRDRRRTTSGRATRRSRQVPRVAGVVAPVPPEGLRHRAGPGARRRTERDGACRHDPADDRRVVRRPCLDEERDTRERTGGLESFGCCAGANDVQLVDEMEQRVEALCSLERLVDHLECSPLAGSHLSGDGRRGHAAPATRGARVNSRTFSQST